MEQINSRSENAAKLLCLFMAEEMRMRMMSLGEAKEIAAAYVKHKKLIDNEEHMLRLTIELSKDFASLKRFEKKLAYYIEKQSRTDGEKQITEFVATIMDSDPQTAMGILSDAIDENNNIEKLKIKYPNFAQFIESQKL